MPPQPMASKFSLIYEGENANIGLNSLDGSVVTHPRTDGEGSGMHNKFIIGDADHAESAFVLTGSTNLTTGQLVSDLNNVIVLEDQSLARAYELEFEEMWGAEGMTPDAANAKFGADKSWNTPVDFLVGGSPVSCIRQRMGQMQPFVLRLKLPMRTLSSHC